MRKTKSALILIIAITILSILVFVGCSSMKTSNNSIAITKTIYLGTLKTMVSDNTITQTQSDKVLAEVLNNVNIGYGCIDGVSELVESGVINKAQANLINQKIQMVMNSRLQLRQ